MTGEEQGELSFSPPHGMRHAASMGTELTFQLKWPLLCQSRKHC